MYGQYWDEAYKLCPIQKPILYSTRTNVDPQYNEAPDKHLDLEKGSNPYKFPLVQLPQDMPKSNNKPPGGPKPLTDEEKGVNQFLYRKKGA